MVRKPERPFGHREPGTVVRRPKGAARGASEGAKGVAPVNMEGVRFAGFWIRALAAVIDGILLSLVTAGMGFAFVSGMGVNVFDLTQAPNAILLAYLASVLVAVLYYVILTSSRWQGTVGKRIVGIRVATAAGGRLTFLHAFARYFCYFASALPLGIGYMMAGWTKEKTALHDMICGTRVIRGRD